VGIDVWTARFLKSEAKRGVDFTRTLTLGRQTLYMTPDQYAEVYAPAATSEVDPRGLFADAFLSSLGAQTLDAIDISDYEGAGIIHDLNLPLKTAPEQRWTCVLDGGALEHIFHFPTAIKSCMEATAIGGHFLSACPWTGFAGHGFYQFSPELLYRVLSPANGFKVERMVFRHGAEWREIIDPEVSGQRFEYQSKQATLLFVSARRTHEAKILQQAPQQSDYVTMWSATQTTHGHTLPGFTRRVVEALVPRLADKFRARRKERRMLEHGTVRTSL